MRELVKRLPLAIPAYVLFRRVKALAAATFKGDDALLIRDEASHYSDGFATTHHVGFMDDARFLQAFADAIEGIPEPQLSTYKGILWRAHICCWAANQAMSLEGDFVECGVWYGVLSKAICNYVDLNSSAKAFHLVDSWGEMDGSHPSYTDDVFEAVKKRFAPYRNARLIRGLVPDALDRIDADKIAYLSIDMNGSTAERAALDRLYERVVPGGVIYFDDYGWGYPALRATVDEFFSDKPEKLLHFPSGNSIAVKV